MKRKPVPPASANQPQPEPGMSDPIRLLIEQQEGKTEPSVAITIHVPRRELRAFIAALEKFLLLATTCATTCAGWCE